MESENFLKNIPAELKRLSQWVYNKDKVPHQSKTRKAKSNDSRTWVNFTQALNYKVMGMDGIAFVLTEDDPYTIIDLDKCIVNGKMNDFAKKVCGYFASYAEKSPSGNGIHIVIKGKLEKAIKTVEIEAYSNKKCMAFTGNLIWDFEIVACQGKLDAIDKKYNPKVPEKPINYPNKFKDNSEYKLPKRMFADGNRNNDLAQQCGIIKNKVKSENEYWYHVFNVNKQCCSPPLPEREVRLTGNSIWRM